METSLRAVPAALGLSEAEAVITYSTVTASFIDHDGAEAIAATQVVRRWQPDDNRLAAAASLTRAIRDGRADVETAEVELDRVERSAYLHPRWLGFAAPAFLSTAVTIMFQATPEPAARANAGEQYSNRYSNALGTAANENERRRTPQFPDLRLQHFREHWRTPRM